jgi:hypothetical protein
MSSTTPSPEPRADLRTLAVEAIRKGSKHFLTPESLADAVLAAVLPEHRRMVLGEAGKALERARQARIRADGHPIGSGWDEAEWVLDRLAAAAPPASLSAPVPAENAPAVPEPPVRPARDADALTYAMPATHRAALAYQVAQYQRVVEQVRALTITEDGHPLHPTKRVAVADIIAAVDALPDAGPHQHECACNRNWGGPCGPCVCEEPPRQGVWRLACGAERIPPNQTYATKGAAEDVMRLHDGACSGAHAVEFVPDAGTDQPEDDRA